ncbi:MAG: hypothetical protein Q8L49_01425, partial [Burkholderiaceae bacterium]|nr:hypothetical protein [Burkholderiaceae bacterium]
MVPLSVSRRRAGALALVAAGVLGAHGWLLSALGPAWIDPDDRPAGPLRLSVRSVAAAPRGA